MNKKIILIFSVLILGIYLAGAQQGKLCEGPWDCSEGYECSSNHQCTAKATTQVTLPPPQPSAILPPPPQPPLQVQEPVAAQESRCGDGLIQYPEECELPLKNEGDSYCQQRYGQKNYVCDYQCKCVSYGLKVPEQKFCGDGVCTVEKGESPLTCSEDCKAVPKQELSQCPEGTERVTETDLVSGEEFAYCVEKGAVLPPPPEVPSMKKNVCSGQVFYLKQREDSKELEFSLPWNPDSASLSKFDELKNNWVTLVESAVFENNKLKLALSKGSYLMNVEKNGVEHKLPVEVVEAQSTQIYDVVVDAQNADVKDGDILVKYLAGFGLKAVLSKANNLKDLPPSELRVFLGGPFANNLVEKAVPGASEQMMNLNTNRIVSANTLVLAGWCQEATIMTNYQLQDEVDDELATLLEDKEPTKEDVMNVLKSKKSETGKEIACTPEEPLKTEELKTKGKRESRKPAKGLCPQEKVEYVCTRLCYQKSQEGEGFDIQVTNDGCTCRFFTRTKDRQGNSVEVQSRTAQVSKEEVLRICLDRNGNVDQAKLDELERATRELQRERRAEQVRAREERRRALVKGFVEGFENAQGPEQKKGVVRDMMSRLRCSGETACQNYCDYKAEEGEQVTATFNDNEMRCTCVFTNAEGTTSRDQKSITPGFADRFCRAQRSEESSEQAAREEEPAERQTEPERSSCTLREVCDNLCVSRLSGTLSFNTYTAVAKGDNSCTCQLANTRSRDTVSKVIPATEVNPYLSNQELCDALRTTAKDAKRVVNAR
ncbi:hypothetical protein HZA97_06950 [Candidatus Woesearchaeota archaeon]|nr:hypothetical protein [Candidatus Woesearchaeota archaeon]